MLSGLIVLLCRLLLLATCLLGGYALVLAAVAAPPLGCGLLAYAAWRQLRSWQGSGYAFGTARFADLMDFQRWGLFGGSGLFLGTGYYSAPPSRRQALLCLFSPFMASRTAVLMFLSAWVSSRWQRRFVLLIASYVHILTVAPSGRGKGVSVVCPTLLTHTGSMLVTDPKDGELFGLTAKKRGKFGRVYRLDPYSLHGPGGLGFNPLAFLKPDAPDFFDSCTDIANMMIIRPGRSGENDHFYDMAELFLAGVIAFVVSCEADPAKRTLQCVRDIVSNPDRFAKTIDLMSSIGFLARQAGQMKFPADRERGSIMSTLQRMSNWLDSSIMAAHTGVAEGFDPLWLRQYPGSTVFLCLPAHRVNAAALMRLWVGVSLQRLTAAGEDRRRRVYFLLDEAAMLGHSRSLEAAVTTVRSAGINLHFVFQSLDQIKACYGENSDIFISNMDTQQFFGVNSVATAEMVCKRLGDATIVVESYNKSTSHSRPVGPAKEPQPGSVQVSRSLTRNEHGRPLLRIDELTRLSDSACIVFHRNLPPMLVELVRYYDSPLFRGRRRGRSRGVGLAALVVTLIAAAVSLAAAIAVEELPNLRVRLPVAGRPYGSPYPRYRLQPAFEPLWWPQ